MSNILITGVTRGIGKALATEFDKLGHRVIGCGRNLDNLKQLQNQLSKHSVLSAVDIKNSQEVINWATQIAAMDINIDIIINNAGVKSQLLPIWEIPESDFEQAIQINVLGIVNIIRAFVPTMLKEKNGVIFNMTSEWGHYADAYVSSYCASKFAVEALTQSLAKELPEGMSAIALNPYFVRTDLLESCKSLFLPGEYELSISPQEWANFSASKILEMGALHNGKSVTIHPLAV